MRAQALPHPEGAGSYGWNRLKSPPAIGASEERHALYRATDILLVSALSASYVSTSWQRVPLRYGTSWNVFTAENVYDDYMDKVMKPNLRSRSRNI